MPGSPLDPRAEGTNDLIRQGATLVAEAEHVLEVIGPIVARGLDPDAAPFRPRPDLAEQPDFWEELDLDGEIWLFPLPKPPWSMPTPATSAAASWRFSGPAPLVTDELARMAECSVRTVQTVLLELELDGRIERQGSGMVALVRR